MSGGVYRMRGKNDDTNHQQNGEIYNLPYNFHENSPGGIIFSCRYCEISIS